MAEPEGVEGRNGGTLIRHLKGSNGGTKRGLDLQPRNFMRAVVLEGDERAHSATDCFASPEPSDLNRKVGD